MSTPAEGDAPWRVVRQDDNGNRYLVAVFEDHEQAQRARAEFESRGHKQIYWVERAGSAGAGGTAP
jgi:hypothetical protein